MALLVTLSEMKTYLGIDSGDTTNDAFLTSQITTISDSIESYCQRVFAQTTYSETFYGADYCPMSYLMAFMFPLISVTSITEDGTLLDAANYRIHKPTGRVTRTDFGGFFCPEITVVVYSAGFAAIPEPLKSVVYSLVGERYNKKINGVDLNFGSDVQRISIPGTISVDFDYSLQNNQRDTKWGAILGNYINVIDAYRSDRAAIPSDRLAYVV